MCWVLYHMTAVVVVGVVFGVIVGVVESILLNSL